MKAITIGLVLAYSQLADGVPVDFEQHIAPILAEHCLRCHSPGNSKGDISLARPDGLMENGYVESGSPDESHLVDLIAGVDGEPPEMPKESDPLTAEQVELVRRWIAEGAAWPQGVVVREKAKASGEWWSLQPLKTPSTLDSIDDFISRKLRDRGLSMNPPADRRTLIRRASYDLTGLPPTPQEIESFVNDSRPDAYERLVDGLLDSPHYGERWGRHWLDVVRFGESIGYERNVIVNNVWPFRDYVIRSLNADKPFDQFIREHLAGDVFAKDDPDTAIGSAFLVAGPYDDVGNQDAAQAAQIRANTIDEIINATGQAFLGLTVGCARCHDHKFDPILQRDYYAFYATFAGIRHGSTTLATPEAIAERMDKLKPLERKKANFQSDISKLENDILERGRQKIEEYRRQWTRPAVDRTGTVEEFEPVAVKYVRIICEARDTTLRSKTGFGIDELEIWSEAKNDNPSINVALESGGAVAAGRSRHIEDFPGAYAPRLAIDGQTGARFIAGSDNLTIELPVVTRIQRIVFSSARDAAKPRQGKFSFIAEYRIEVSSDGEQWREIAHGRDRKPTDLASNPTHEEYRLKKLETTLQEKNRLAKLRKELREVDRKIAEIPALPSVWIGKRVASDAKGPFHIFLGGSPQKKGEVVVPASLAILNSESHAYQLTADEPENRRREQLAEWITHENNPLTPRVLANRVWHYHFGTGIVDTPSDLGYMGGRPTHPELLDFLARHLVDAGWRLKPLHRLIMLSKAYRQSSAAREAAADVDANSRYLWRFPPRRLSAEEIRDTMLLVGGKIDVQHQAKTLVPDGGPGFRLYHFMQDNVCTYVPLDKHDATTYRRAVYHQNARASVVDLMSDFDQPDCTFSVPKRAETTTPLQALTMLNHSFTGDMARALSQRLKDEVGDSVVGQIHLAYQHCYGRNPTDDETNACLEFSTKHGMPAMCRVWLNTSELIFVR